MRIEDERIRLRGELAGLRLLTALTRLELKCRADQARVPKGQPGGGRFADEQGAGRTPTPSFVAPHAPAAARTAAAAEAGVAAAAEGAAATAGATAGALGGAMLGLTGDSRVSGPTSPSAAGAQAGASRAPISLKAREACEADYDDDVTRCYHAFGLERMTYNPGHDALRQCIVSANDRLADCLRQGGPGRTSLSLKLPQNGRGG